MDGVQFADGFDRPETLALGLSAPQLVAVVVGTLGGYAIVRSPLPELLRWPAAALVVGAAAALSWGRVAGRPLLSWAWLYARFVSSPRAGGGRPDGSPGQEGATAVAAPRAAATRGPARPAGVLQPDSAASPCEPIPRGEALGQGDPTGRGTLLAAAGGRGVQRRCGDAVPGHSAAPHGPGERHASGPAGSAGDASRPTERDGGPAPWMRWLDDEPDPDRPDRTDLPDRVDWDDAPPDPDREGWDGWEHDPRDGGGVTGLVPSVVDLPEQVSAGPRRSWVPVAVRVEAASTVELDHTPLVALPEGRAPDEAGGAVTSIPGAAQLTGPVSADGAEPNGGRPARCPAALGRPRVIALFSLKGGSGRTTLATELGCLLAERGITRVGRGPSEPLEVVLLDLDTDCPDCAVRLGLRGPVLADHLETLHQRPERLRHLLVEHPTGLRVLLGPAAASPSLAGAGALDAVLAELGRQGTELALLDLPASLNPVSTWALRRADEIVVVGTPTAAGIHATYRAVGAARRLGRPDRLHLVVNRARPGVEVGEMVGDLRVPLLGTIPDDPGVLIAEDRHECAALDGAGPAAAAIEELARALVPEALLEQPATAGWMPIVCGATP